MKITEKLSNLAQQLRAAVARFFARFSRKQASDVKQQKTKRRRASKKAQQPPEMEFLSAKAKRAATHKRIQHQQGHRNSQYGSMWITNGHVNRKIRKGDPIPANWAAGRVIEFRNRQYTPTVQTAGRPIKAEDSGPPRFFIDSGHGDDDRPRNF